MVLKDSTIFVSGYNFCRIKAPFREYLWQAKYKNTKSPQNGLHNLY